jgi:YD repeat-containing protein
MTYYYDALGRPIETVEQDNSVLQWCYNGVQSTPAVYCSPSHLGSVTTGTWVDATDENGNHWQRTSDAFGRLREVMEPNGTSQSASMETDYGYDALNNLLSVTQWGGASGSSGGRSRSFTYDNLSRLLSAANPETGTVGYAYDFNGNVLSKTDARGMVTSYIYNGINQVLSKSYSDGATPLSCYQYGTSANSVERLINEWTQSASATALCQTSAPFLAKRGNITYDRMGRVLSEQQYTLATQASAAQTPYSPAYSYDLAGNLISSTTGVGPTPTAAAITFTNTIDSAGRLQTVNSNLTSNWVTGAALPATLFSSTPGTNTSCTGLTYQYWPFGGLMNATLGNGLTLNRAFDSRLRTACETDTGSVVANSIPGAAAVTITGAEQSH